MSGMGGRRLGRKKSLEAIRRKRLSLDAPLQRIHPTTPDSSRPNEAPAHKYVVLLTLLDEWFTSSPARAMFIARRGDKHAARVQSGSGRRSRQHLLRWRVERAKSLMARTDEPLFDIASRVGFRTKAHFTAVFERFVGMTPGRWRLAECRSRGWAG